jgi:hypothetical protein
MRKVIESLPPVASAATGDEAHIQADVPRVSRQTEVRPLGRCGDAI